MSDELRHAILRSVAEEQEEAYARGKRRLHVAIGIIAGVLLAWAWGKVA